MEADEKKCPQCAEMVKAEARICRYCGHSFEAEAPADAVVSAEPSKSGSALSKGWLILLGAVVVLWIIGALVGSGNDTEPAVETMTSDTVEMPDTVELPSTVELPAIAEEAEAELSIGFIGPQANARRSAEQYLNISGFSRQGLIDQLSSDAGDGYNVADATAAVDSLRVDWNEQAARSAQQYIGMMGFSCSGLIEQLSSSSGERYTESQARYGARQAGAC